MTTTLRRRVARGRGDEGIALVGVMGVMTIVTLFLLSTLAFALQNSKPTRRDQDAKTALAAAQAGLDDYVARLNSSADYWQKGNIDIDNKAFTTGRPIPGSTGGSGTYKYSLLTAPEDVASGGTIRLKAVGSSRGVSRSLTASFTPNGFLQYVYHTDKETLDPVLFSTDPAVIAACSTYWYTGRSTASGCKEIGFGGGDVINGPLHTNDAINVASVVTFTDPKTESSWLTPTVPNQYYRGTANPLGNKPVYKTAVEIPASNDGLRAAAASTVTNDGCVYTGATKITFTGKTMSVLSPNTTSGPSRCYNVTAANKAAVQTGIAIPKIIYVDDLAGVCAKTPAPANLEIRLGYPLAGEYLGEGTSAGNSVYSGDYLGPVYGCGNGTAYVQGVVDGGVTVASAQDVVIVGNLNYQDEGPTSTDVVGLIPGHFAWVYHPVAKVSGTYSNLLATPVTQIDAAILAVKDSFIVQSYAVGPPVSSTSTGANKLRVFGAIAQKFRGTVAATLSGVITSGYIKDYVYDTRFGKGVQPPYFLKPVSAQWQVSNVSDG